MSNDVPLPSQTDSIEELSSALDRIFHAERLAWMQRLNGNEMLALYELAEGNPVTLDDLAPEEGVLAHEGKNGMPLFNRFQKRFARLDDQVVGFNWNGEIAGGLTPVVQRVTGPGHYTAYPSPDREGEVWIDYRRLPDRAHPEFPPLTDNETGLRSLVFGNMVDIVRRVSEDVFVGNAYKNLPDHPQGGPRFGARVGSLLPTAPFVLVRPEAP